MKLRRMATTVAAASALVLAGAAPALADHAPAPELVPGNPDCDAVAAEFDIDGLVSLDKVEFDDDQPMTIDVDPDNFPDFDILVIVKGANNANVFFEPPFHELFAPENPGEQDPEISHYEVCGVETDNGETPTPTPTPTPEPTEEPTEEPEETTPAVPTEIPAGTGSPGAGSAGNAVLVGLLAAFAAGVAVIVRRRFLTES